MATRSPARRSTVRRTFAHPAPARPQGRTRPGRLRRFIKLGLVLFVALLAVRTYVLHVYAPGLHAEVRSLPSRVHDQLAQHNAAYVPLSDISPNLQHAIVAIEDRRFYYHFGVDPLGVIRALWVNLTAQHVDQGGSTLEEQLIKRAIVGDDRSIHAKLRTMALAWAADGDFSKSRILEMYLNDAYYGQGAYGADAAARTYFGVDVAQLTVPEAAFLAALPQAPSVYGARPRSTAIMQRQKTVLRDMAASGYISAAQERADAAVPLTFALPNP